MSGSWSPIQRRQERCREARAGLSDYLDGELGEARAIERHLRWCPNCRRMMVNLRRTIAGLHRVPAPRRP